RKFMVFVPAGYTAEKKWPAILFMHGLGGAGDDGAQQVATGLGHYIAEHWRTFGFIVVFPQSSWDWHRREQQDEAMAAMEQVEKSYSVDRERVILSGISLGGYGAYCLAARYPEKFCAVVTMSGLSEERVAKKLT